MADFQARALASGTRGSGAAGAARGAGRRRPALRLASRAGRAARVLRLFSYLPGLPRCRTPRVRRRSATTWRGPWRGWAGCAVRTRGRRWRCPGTSSAPTKSRRCWRTWPTRRVGRRGAMARFTEHARPALPGLRAQAIHNDLNLYNVLVDPRDHDVIAGILDFGDMVRARWSTTWPWRLTNWSRAPIRWRQPFRRRLSRGQPAPGSRAGRAVRPDDGAAGDGGGHWLARGALSGQCRLHPAQQRAVLAACRPATASRDAARQRLRVACGFQ